MPRFRWPILYRAVDRFRFVVPEGFEITEITSPLLGALGRARAKDGREDGQRPPPRADDRDRGAEHCGRPRAAPLAAWQFPRWEPLDVVGHVAVLGLLAERPLKAEIASGRAASSPST